MRTSPSHEFMVADGGAFSHPGPRDHQQDRWYVGRVRGGVVGAVADGVTSHPMSEMVAEVACQVFLDVASRRVEADPEDAVAAVAAGARAAERMSFERSRLQGGGTCGFAGAFLGDDGTVVMATAGDVKVYGILEGKGHWEDLQVVNDVGPDGGLLVSLGKAAEGIDWDDRVVRQTGYRAVVIASDGFYKTMDELRGGAAAQLEDGWVHEEPPGAFVWARDLVQRAASFSLQDNCTVMALVRRPRERPPFRPGVIPFLASLGVALAIGFFGGIVAAPGLRLPLPSLAAVGAGPARVAGDPATAGIAPVSDAPATVARGGSEADVPAPSPDRHSPDPGPLAPDAGPAASDPALDAPEPGRGGPEPGRVGGEASLGSVPIEDASGRRLSDFAAEVAQKLRRPVQLLPCPEVACELPIRMPSDDVRRALGDGIERVNKAEIEVRWYEMKRGGNDAEVMPVDTGHRSIVQKVDLRELLYRSDWPVLSCFDSGGEVVCR